MPSAQILVRQANGQSLVLSENDRIVKEITISCESGRCASRHGQDSPVAFTFNDQDTFPEAGDSFMNIILPERSPSNPGSPRSFCSAQCLRDWLVYEYVSPGPRFAAPEPEPNPLTAEQLTGLNSESRATVPPPVCPELDNPEPVAQADGAGE